MNIECTCLHDDVLVQDHDVQLHLPGDGQLGGEVPGRLQAAPLQTREYSTVQYSTVQTTVQYSTVQYSTDT